MTAKQGFHENLSKMTSLFAASRRESHKQSNKRDGQSTFPGLTIPPPPSYTVK